MLDTDSLTKLYRKYRHETVLSIYLDADQRDFAERTRWQRVLKNRTSAARKEAEDPEAFDRALAHLTDELEPEANQFLEGRGWVGFATAGERIHAESLPVPMPNLVRWETGLRVAPYARALVQSRPIVAVLVDSRRARLLHYREGTLSESARLHADTYLGDLTDVTTSKRASAHSGIRGATGTDAAQRFLEVERDRLLARVEDEVRAEAGESGVIVLGGVERAVGALAKRLVPMGEARVTVRPGLSFDMTDAEIRATVEDAASEMTGLRQRRLVERLVDLARANGDACLGDRETERALREGRVDTLVVSDRLRTSQPDRVDHLEGAAFEQSADVIEVAREAATTLDREADGVGALLRY